MRYRIKDKILERLDQDPAYSAGLELGVVKAFRKRMQLIRGALDERDFYALKALHYEKLKGDRQHQRSMRLNNQWRLVLEVESGSEGNVIVVIAIEDYH